MTVALVLGAVVGLVMALTGAGGGVLAVPLLVFGVDASVAVAAPVALLAGGVAAGAGAFLGLRNGIVRYRAAALMAGAGFVPAMVAVSLSHHVADRLLALLFSAVVAFVSYRSWRPAKNSARDPACDLGDVNGRFVWTARCARTLAAVGAVAGTLSGLLGVGGGFIIVPALKRFSPLDAHSVIATSLAVIALVSISGVLAAGAAGRIDWSIAVPFAGGAIAGMTAGRRFARALPERWLRLLFAAVTALTAAGMCYRALFLR